MSVSDPGLFALKGAARLALVLPSAFALALLVLDLPQAALFAAFGSVAMLVFADFGGPRPARLRAYTLLALAGAPLVALGTLCSRSTAAAVGAMAVVGFAILFAGILNGYVAAAQTAVILAFVLPVMVAADPAEIPARLLGWALAATLSTAAALLLWPARPRDAVRADAAVASRALADLVEAGAGDASRTDDLDRASGEAIASVRRRFLSLQHRPSGTGGRTAALARLIEDLGWLRATAARAVQRSDRAAELQARRPEIERLIPASLRAAASGLEGDRLDALREDLAALERAHRETGRVLLAGLAKTTPEHDEAEARLLVEEGYRLRALAFGAAEAAAEALRVEGEQVEDPGTGAWERLRPAGRLVRAHANMRSVWLRNSVRGAVGLAAAVLVGHLGDVQNSFWVVLGTLSVLRSDALATGATIVEALAGTLVGIVLGGLLIVAVDGSEAALWAALPPAALLAAYAPRAVSFVAGQAAFSLLILILFNLLDTGGWQVGLVRIEDVAIGSAVSLLIGVLLWPRGAVTVLQGDLGDAYRDSADLLRSTAERLLGQDADPEAAARKAFVSSQALDAAVRDYLHQRSSARRPIADLTALSGGAARVRHVAALLGDARVLVRLGPVDSSDPRLEAAREAFDVTLHTRCGWFSDLGTALASAAPAPPPEKAVANLPPQPGPIVLDRPDGHTGVPPGLGMAWATLHLEVLLTFEPVLAEAAGRLLGDTRG